MNLSVFTPRQIQIDDISLAKSDFNYRHGTQEKLGILLVNLGSPDKPEASAVRRYLAEFLWDKRIVDAPRWLWWLILHGIILRTRPRRSARLYQKVWTDQGSPLVATSRSLAQMIEKTLQQKFRGNVIVDLGMRYGKPSVRDSLNALRKAGARRLLVLPMYPQYSATTTASVFDEVTNVLQEWRWLPDLRFINHYHDNRIYIEALANSIRQHWQQNGRADKLLFSFHGIPQRYFESGDPYFCHCHKTTRLVAEALELGDDDWQLVFQSRFGREPWLQPYCDKTLEALPSQGIKSVDIICPGFTADCLETLEEIAMENRDIFINAGGEQYHYIPALNDSDEHIKALCEVLTAHCFGWPETMPGWDAGKRAVEENKSRERALNMGANQEV
ncbi:MAG: ferrochelatase [Gammaproteobacteria bacterium]|nr:ferrochelatase [Gammaproteobacteria bacterium]